MAVVVVVAADGYPGSYAKGEVIEAWMPPTRRRRQSVSTRVHRRMQMMEERSSQPVDACWCHRDGREHHAGGGARV